MSGDDTEQRGYASPACSMHEIDPAYLGLPLSPEAVALWRKGERARLIAMRLAMSAEERADRTRRIAQRLDALIGDPAGLVVSAYWPFRGEPDLRPWLEELRRRGARTALPVVVAMAAPLAFRSWRQGDRLERGVWNIPVPADGEVVEPQIALAPVVGYDAACYRLGYGGGFFDRTLARLPASTLAIGVGYAEAEIATIHPQPFDIPMRHVVTEAGTRAR
jgi:5,10-methenyltetrahydrofolate synthetase